MVALRFIVDQGMSPTIADELRRAGYDAVHTHWVGFAAASDTEIVECAIEEGRVIITQDVDYSDIMYKRGLLKPAIVLFRDRRGKPALHRQRLIGALPDITAALAEGAIIVFGDASMRVRMSSGRKPHPVYFRN